MSAPTSPQSRTVTIKGRTCRVWHPDEMDARGRTAFFAVAVRFAQVNPLVYGRWGQDDTIAAMIAVFKEFVAICVPDLPADTLASLTDDETGALVGHVTTIHRSRRPAIAPA